MDALEELLQKTNAVIAERRCLPEATYRLQFHAGFTFRDAARIIPYLRDLGITHCYASPYLKARPGSTHGYDIIDHNCLNPEIGNEDDYAAYVAALKEHRLGQILDTVPNHMGVATNDNAWWNDVLENGPLSRYAAFFDIAWRASPRPELKDKVLLPVLGDPYGDVLENSQFRLAFEDGAFAVYYYERRFPIAPHTYGKILGQRIDELRTTLGAESPELLEYESIVTASRNLPTEVEATAEAVAERNREKEVIRRRLATLARESQPVREFIEQNVKLLNGTPGDPRSFDSLDELLEQQCHRLSFWRVASDEINYRRFFDINDLAALATERQDVFDAVHRLVLRLLADGTIDGLRIDHPDGLYDPDQYFRRLQEHYVLACAKKIFDTDPAFGGRDWNELEPQLRERIKPPADAAAPWRWPLYVIAEKILGIDEKLVETWSIYGTSGYHFINMAGGLFVDSANAPAMTQLYTELLQDTVHFSDLVYEKKMLILRASLSSELNMLTHQLDRLAQKNRKSRDFTFNTLRTALREVIACFPVYRSYITDTVTDADRRYVDTAIRRASVRNPVVSRRVLRFIRNMLLETIDSFNEQDRAEQRRFAGKFQQVTAPVTAKGIEDTAFYNFNRLISLNEVGGEPGRFGIPPVLLHRYNSERQAKWPYALSPLSTHDTKRSEDVRVRIHVLSEIPGEWREAVFRWRQLNQAHRIQVEELEAPDANEDYLLYQTLIGAWPLEPYTPEEYAEFVKRIQAYMEKALHEAKLHTSWINPNEEYDKAIREYVARVLNEEGNRAFLDDFRAWQRRISHHGLLNSLSQTLLKLTCPGAPDTYQGTELWDFSLVDPDNRRPVNYERRHTLLRELFDAAKDTQNLAEFARALANAKEDGRVKLYVTQRALHCRRDRPGLFSAGDYIPLEISGARSDNVFAFARRAGDGWAVVAVPRLTTRLAGPGQLPLGPDVWNDTRLELPEAAGQIAWQNVFTNQQPAAADHNGKKSLLASDLFADFPVALLVSRQS